MTLYAFVSDVRTSAKTSYLIQKLRSKEEEQKNDKLLSVFLALFRISHYIHMGYEIYFVSLIFWKKD